VALDALATGVTAADIALDVLDTGFDLSDEYIMGKEPEEE